MKNTSRSNEALSSMQTWCDELRHTFEKPKYSSFSAYSAYSAFLRGYALSHLESPAAKEHNITDINYVFKQLGLSDIRSLSTINIKIKEIQNWGKWSAWLFNQSTPHKFIVVKDDIESHQEERLEWLARINFICLLEWIINELKKFELILTCLFSDTTDTAEIPVNNHSYNLLIKLKFQLKNSDQLSDQLKETSYTQAELDELNKILDEFCVDQANDIPLRQAINKLTSSATMPEDCRKMLDSFITNFFNAHFSNYKAKMHFFKNRANAALKEKQDELNNKNRGRVFENPSEALADTCFVTNPNVSTKTSLSEQDIENIDKQFNKEIRKKSKKDRVEKQLLRVHNHASKLHRRHQWMEKWKKNRFYRFIISLLLGSHNHDVERQKYTVLYRVIKLVLEKDLENNPNKNCLDQIKTIKSDSINLLCQHRSRWRRARFKSGVTTSLQELNQLENLLSKIPPSSLN